MIKVTYHWKHKPSGKEGKRRRVFVSRESVTKSLEFWNLDSNWHYWLEQDYDPIPATKQEIESNTYSHLGYCLKSEEV